MSYCFFFPLVEKKPNPKQWKYVFILEQGAVGNKTLLHYMHMGVTNPLLLQTCKLYDQLFKTVTTDTFDSLKTAIVWSLRYSRHNID
jgi:hypothetical protein